jgi:hypothetical protein
MVRSEPDGVFSKRLGALEPLGDAVQFLLRRGTGSKEREHVLHPINNRQRDVHAIDLRGILRQVLRVVEQWLDRANVDAQARALCVASL